MHHSRPSTASAGAEFLESRTLLSVSPLITRTAIVPVTSGANINVSRLSQNQTEGSIVIDPSDRSRQFAFSNEAIREGMMAAYSTNGGKTWTRRRLATSSDGLPSACCDPSAVFDEYGNLFIAYMHVSTSELVVARSVNGGRSFQRIGKFTGDVDQPTLTSGGGAVWVTFAQSGRIRVSGARVNGLGQIGAFSAAKQVPSRNDSNFGDITVGPAGQVVVAFQSPTSGSGPSKLYTSLDPDGLGPEPFQPYTLAATTNVGGFTGIPAQPDGEIDAEVAVAYDRSDSIAKGRLYMIYTGMAKAYAADTSVLMRISKNNGASWSQAIRLDTDSARSSQFLPRLAVDQTTGHIAVTWLDTRNDANPARSGIDTDGEANTDVQAYGIIATPTSGGIRSTPNFRISRGASNARPAMNSIDFGDYQGLAFHDGLIVPLWSDNSNSTRNNPDGKSETFDIYIARITDPFL